LNRENIRNVAIIAHVDHGKTTLVDELLKQSGVFRENQVISECVLDSNELERERGITILAKNTAVYYKGIKINIVDTPGHADFGGEVERVLKMADGVLLLVDAFEGPMPQTRFVLSKAFELSLSCIVVITKMDRPDARPAEVADEVLSLFIDLGADNNQLDSPIIYASSRYGWANTEPVPARGISVLFNKIIEHIPCPKGDPDGPLQLLISTIDYNDYVGRIGIGKIERGRIQTGNEVVISNFHASDDSRRFRVTSLYCFEGLKRVPVQEAYAGDIVAVSGITDLSVGDTLCDVTNPEPVPFVKIGEPTVSMNFMVNDSPFAGREGKYVTSRHLRQRLIRELETDVSLRVEETDSPDCFKVSGRGELHLSILIETMRRQGYELQVSKPEVILKEIDGVVCEPVEQVTVDVPESCVGAVIEKLGRRKGELKNIANGLGGRTRLEFIVPSRGLIGYRSEFLTDTRGEGIINTYFSGYAPHFGKLSSRDRGSLIAFETGETVTYGLYNAQERGTLFLGPGVKVYAGMIVGVNNKSGDLEVNVCKKKQLTNMRAAGSDENLRLTPPHEMSLEDCLEFIADDELLEVTPQSLRMRKKILDSTARYRAARKSS